MSEQDLKFIKNLFASLDYDRMYKCLDIISSIIKNGEAYKKIEEFYSPIHDIAQFFINPQIDKKLGILPIVILGPRTLRRISTKFSIPLLKKDEIELWKILDGVIQDTIKQTEFRILDAMRKNGATILTIYDDGAAKAIITHPYEFRDIVLSNFIKFVINKKKQIGDKVFLCFDSNSECKILNDFNYKVYCDEICDDNYYIYFNSYELYHEYLLYAMSDCKATPAQLSIYSSNGIDLLQPNEDNNFEDRLTMHFLLQLPSFVVNYEQLIKIDQDRIKKQRAKKKQHQQTMQHLQSAGFNFGKTKKKQSHNPKGDLLEFSDAQTQQDQQTKQTQAYILKKIRQQNQRLLVDKLQDL